FWSLGNTPFERQMAWAAFVKEGAPHWEDRQITETLIRSKPWVSESCAKKLFKGQTEQALIRHRGRPKKLVSINSMS
ncbi:MAG: transposase, partial [Polynucleobacter sp. 35-46-207]